MLSDHQSDAGDTPSTSRSAAVKIETSPQGHSNVGSHMTSPQVGTKRTRHVHTPKGKLAIKLEPGK